MAIAACAAPCGQTEGVGSNQGNRFPQRRMGQQEKQRRLCSMLIRNQKDFWSGVMFTAFGLFLPRLGLIISLITVVLVSSYASHEFGWRAALINTVVLVVLCLAVFVYALSLQFPLWPTFFAG